MAEIELKYGQTHYYFEFDKKRFDVLEPETDQAALSDFELNEALDQPIGTPLIEEIVNSGEKVLIVVPDATREVACGQVVNILVRRLIANGTSSSAISIIFATGIHRPVTQAEKEKILTPFIAQRIKTLDHAPRDISRITRMGETSGGIPIELNSALVEHDHVILIGGVTFHYFAGFTGSRKLICPGLASTKTISGSHKLAFDCDALSRRAGVGTGMLDGNAVHEAFVEAASKAAPAFCINTIVNDTGEAVDLICGDWIESHKQACEVYARRNTIAVPEKRRLVIAGCGGAPYDLNLIQAHKALEAAAGACVDGGTIILLAECREGLGRDDFLKWFEFGDSEKLAERLCEAYQVNGQTAWSLLCKTEKFDVRIVTDLPEGKVAATGMKYSNSLADALNGIKTDTPGYIMPSGSKVLIAAGELC